MAMNPMMLMQLKERYTRFTQDHPKIVPFLSMLGQQALEEGTVLELKVTRPDGQEYVSNIRLNANDLETIELLHKQSK